MKYIVLMLLAVLQLVLAGILRYKKHSKVSQVFVLFAINMAVWTVINILLDYYQFHVKDSLATIDILNRLGFLAGSLSLLFVYRLSLIFPIERAKTKITGIITVLGVIIPIATLLPIVAGTFSQSKPGAVPVYAYGLAVPIVAIYVILVAYFSTRNLFRARHNLQPQIKRQANTVFAGLVICVLWAIFFIILLPSITGLQTYLFIGYYAPFFFTGAISYSIARQQLLDFSLLVARSIAYVLAGVVVAILYGVLIFGVSTRLLGSEHLNLIQQGFYIAAALFVAFTLQPLRRFFDRVTNKIFYRDAYDPQALLDDLNKTLVSTIELDKLLYGVAHILGDTLKADFCMLGIKAIGNSEQRVIGTDTKAFKELDIHLVRQLTPPLEHKTIITDELEDKHTKIREILRKEDVAMLVRLTESPNQKTEGLGYIIMGDKKSGNPYSGQDVKILEIIADELVIAVQNALRFEEIQVFNATLQAKVTEATKELRHSNEKLKQLDETKDDFISMASHQLRTPLTSVKGYVSMVLDGDAGKITEQQRKLLDQSFISSQRMVYLIADLLNVSRLKTGKFVIEAKPTNLAEVVQSELEQLKETAKGRGLKLLYEQPKNFPALNLDDTKIRQVIMNFTDNAIYYTPSGGTITVGLADKPESIELTVADNGIGVPKAEQHHLFNKFYRAGNARKARPDGTGLGLFMAKKVIAAQGGALIFSSQEGKGSTFGFSFPKAKLLSSNHTHTSKAKAADLVLGETPAAKPPTKAKSD